MLVRNVKSGRVIDVPSNHFEAVLSQQGWEPEVLDKEYIDKEIKKGLQITEVEVNEVPIEHEEIVLEGPEVVEAVATTPKRRVGRPKKVTVQ